MDQIRCAACGADNDADSSFCRRCGGAIASRSVAASGQPSAPSTPSSPSGWDLAAAGMDVAPTSLGDPTTGPLRSDETAHWGARFGAWILDGIILVVLIAVLWGLGVFVLYLAVSEATWSELAREFDSETGSDRSNGLTWLGIGLTYVVVVFWDVLWTRGAGMAKPGQRAAGFRVVRADTLARISFSRALGRGAFKVFADAFCGIVTLVSAITIAASDKHQALHDMVAGTACVKKSALKTRGIGPDAAGSMTHSLHHASATTLPPSLGTSGAMPPRNDGPFMGG